MKANDRQRKEIEKKLLRLIANLGFKSPQKGKLTVIVLEHHHYDKKP
jgi:hypothetical protein